MNESVSAALGKGETLNLKTVSKQTVPLGVFYIGAGWDPSPTPIDTNVDVDIVAAGLVSGKLISGEDRVYYGNKTGCAGIILSDDNTTGEGDGDDESMVIDTSALRPDITSIPVGLICFSNGHDMTNSPNLHFRICDGDNKDATELAHLTPVSGEPGDTLMMGFQLSLGDDGWNMEVIQSFHKIGNDTGAVDAFAKMFA